MVGTGFALAQTLGIAGQFASGLMSAQARQGEFSEQLRRMNLQKQQTVGLANATAGSMGVEMESKSTQDYLQALTGEFDLAIQHMKDTASKTYTADLVGSLSGVLGGTSSLLGTLAAANKWGA